MGIVFVGTCFLYTSIIMMQLSTKSLFLSHLFVVVYLLNIFLLYILCEKSHLFVGPLIILPPSTLSPKSPKVLFDSYHNGFKYSRGFPKQGYLLLVKRHDSKNVPYIFENVANNMNEPFKLIVSQESESHAEALRCFPNVS